MKIPYGNADFADIRRQGMFYVDKTPFLAELEKAEYGYKNLLFLRPRRMGKSSLVSMMAHYYDITRVDEFEELFKGLWVYDHPTPEKNKHVVLALNFGKVTGHDEAYIRERFRECILHSLQDLIPRLVRCRPEAKESARRLLDIVEPTGLLDYFLGLVSGLGLRSYVMIDEYDTFANSLISVGGKDAYQSLTEKTGFVRSFYRTLKAGVDMGGIARIFLTGVAPLLLDDLYTGFNISTNITSTPRFNHLVGFLRKDVERALDEMLADKPELAQDPRLGNREGLLDVLTRHYDGYRFSPDATEHVFNSDMVLYFLQQVNEFGRYPTELLDLNARTDYKKLYGLFESVAPGGDERREVLDTVLTTGKIGGRLVRSYGGPYATPRDVMISLLYYTGMLTLGSEPPFGPWIEFEIPNLVIRNLQWEHLAEMLRDTQGIDLGTVGLVNGQVEMARRGNITPFLDAIHMKVMKILGVKDFIRFDEKAIKMILVTSSVISDIFHVLSEKEFAQGFCDLFMSPKINVPGAKYSWLIELKYLPTKATEKQIQKALDEAEAQVERYTNDGDLVPMLTKGHELRAVAVVFVGSKEIRCRMWPRGSGEEIHVPAKPVDKKASKKRDTKKTSVRKQKS